MPWDVFAALLQAALVPLAEPARHPEAFYAGRRLVGIDGKRFSCGNTPRTPDTAAQEIAALLVAMAMGARARLQVAQAAGTIPLRVSFGRTLAALQPSWMLLSVGGDLLSAAQQNALVEGVLSQLAGRLLPTKRRERGCARGVRQPVKSWPRVHEAQQNKGAYQYELTSTNE